MNEKIITKNTSNEKHPIVENNLIAFSKITASDTPTGINFLRDDGYWAKPQISCSAEPSYIILANDPDGYCSAYKNGVVVYGGKDNTGEINGNDKASVINAVHNELGNENTTRIRTVIYEGNFTNLTIQGSTNGIDPIYSVGNYSLYIAPYTYNDMRAALFKLADNQNCSLICFRYKQNTRAEQCIIDGGHFDGNLANNPAAKGIDTTGTHYLHLINLPYIHHFDKGIYFQRISVAYTQGFHGHFMVKYCNDNVYSEEAGITDAWFMECVNAYANRDNWHMITGGACIWNQCNTYSANRYNYYFGNSSKSLITGGQSDRSGEHNIVLDCVVHGHSQFHIKDLLLRYSGDKTPNTYSAIKIINSSSARRVTNLIVEHSNFGVTTGENPTKYYIDEDTISGNVCNVYHHNTFNVAGFPTDNNGMFIREVKAPIHVWG
jgi:hypothetical protein